MQLSFDFFYVHLLSKDWLKRDPVIFPQKFLLFEIPYGLL